jgi:hypothetical protein
MATKPKPRGRATPTPAIAAAQPQTAKKAASSVARQERPLAPRPATVERTGPIKVRATQLGYYGDMRRRPGDVFSIQRESEFSHKWMEKVDPRTRDRITSPQQALTQRHDEILGGRTAERAASSVEGPRTRPMQTGDDNVADDLPVGTDNPLGD